MKKYLLALCFLLVTNFATAQTGYNTKYNKGVTDITSYLPTTNAWKLLPGNGICRAGSFTIGSDGYVGCIGSGSDWHFYHYDLTSQTWSQISAMGNTMTQYIVMDQAHIYARSGTSGVFKWNGSNSWIFQGGGGISQLSAGDGVLISIANGTGTYISINEGVTWIQISGGSYGPDLSYVSAADSLLRCGVAGRSIYRWESTAFVLMSSQPVLVPRNGGVLNGCVITIEGNILAYGTAIPTGASLYDVGTNTWTAIFGMNLGGAAAVGKATIFALDGATGQPYHLNVYAGFASATTSGYLTNCPDVNHPCNNFPNVHHDGTLKLTFPHCLTGFCSENTQSVSPTTNMDLSSLAVSTRCDVLFGAPNDSECTLIATGTIICSASSTQFSGGGGTVPPPQPVTAHRSMDLRGWDGYAPVRVASTLPPPLVGWTAIVQCSASAIACSNSTVATCAARRPDGGRPPLNQEPYVEYGATCVGATCTRDDAVDGATYGHDTHGTPSGSNSCQTKGTGGKGWAFYSEFLFSNNGVEICTPIYIFSSVAPGVCF